MCTSVVEIVAVEGAGVSEGGWFPVTSAVVSYDHPHHALLEDAITIDFVNEKLGPGARTAVEITLESAKALAGALARAIEAAGEMESARGPGAFKSEVESRAFGQFAPSGRGDPESGRADRAVRETTHEKIQA